MHVPDACRRSGVKIQWKKSDRLAILCHLKADHTHDLIPDTDMIMSHPLARVVPQVAKESIQTMRLAGMCMGSIFKSIKVSNLLVADIWQLACCRRVMVTKPGFLNVISRIPRHRLATKTWIATSCSRGAFRLRNRTIASNLRRCFTTSTQRCRVPWTTTTRVTI